MRHLKTAAGVVVAACLLGTTAAPALAHEFTAFKYKKTASEAEPFKTVAKSAEETKQVFVFGRRTIKCQKALGKGTLAENPTKTLSFKISFTKCGYTPIPTKEEFIPATISGGLSIAFKVDGAGEFEGNGEGEELEYGAKAELKETATTVQIGAGHYCTFIIPTQTIPARAILHPNEEFSQITYSNTEVEVEPTPIKLKLYPGGFQHKVIFSYKLQPFIYKYKEETQCFEVEESEGHKTEYSAGQFKGELTSEVVGGNLEFH
jgi:hypothetical protein